MRLIDAVGQRGERMSLREEQCKKVCRILDNVLANRPTERDSLIVAVRKAFVEPQERKTGKWLPEYGNPSARAHYCSACNYYYTTYPEEMNYCPHCGAKMEVDT